MRTHSQGHTRAHTSSRVRRGATFHVPRPARRPPDGRPKGVRTRPRQPRFPEIRDRPPTPDRAHLLPYGARTPVRKPVILDRLHVWISSQAIVSATATPHDARGWRAPSLPLRPLAAPLPSARPSSPHVRRGPRAADGSRPVTGSILGSVSESTSGVKGPTPSQPRRPPASPLAGPSPIPARRRALDEGHPASPTKRFGLALAGRSERSLTRRRLNSFVGAVKATVAWGASGTETRVPATRLRGPFVKRPLAPRGGKRRTGGIASRDDPPRQGPRRVSRRKVDVAGRALGKRAGPGARSREEGGGRFEPGRHWGSLARVVCLVNARFYSGPPP